MRNDLPSRTAAWVAICRGLAGTMPSKSGLRADPFALRFAEPLVSPFVTAVRHFPELSWRMLKLIPAAAFAHLWVQLRTRALDELLYEQFQRGGRQVVLLGAGYDCRALRLAPELADTVFFEIDHPSTQRRKRGLLQRASLRAENVRYLPWDFERQPLNELAASLGACGFDARLPSLTIWEGVTMYLSPEAIGATVDQVARYSAPGSSLAVEYIERHSIDNPPPIVMALGRTALFSHEPFCFGWDPTELPAWLNRHGLELLGDRSEVQLARHYLTEEMRQQLLALRGGWRVHLATASPLPRPQ